MIKFDLPWPPSVNHYYIRTSRGVVLGKRGRAYRELAWSLLAQYRNRFTPDSRISVTINAFPPDKRKRDIDNICKCVLDSLEYACVFSDDNQIDMLTIIRRHSIKNGQLSLWVTECLEN